MIIGTRNWLADLTLIDASVPATAAGYSALNLWQGGTAQAWRSSNASSVHQFQFRTTAARPVDLVALFDVRALSATITSITLQHRVGWLIGTLTTAGTISLSSRGDGALSLGIPIAADSWVVTVTLSASSVLSVGGMWMGRAAASVPTPASLSVSRQGNAIVNVSDAQTRRATRLASTTRSLGIQWPALTEDEGAQVLAAFDELAGSRSPCVIVPDRANMTGAYYGRIGDGIGHEMDAARLHYGHGFTFDEDGRALG